MRDCRAKEEEEEEEEEEELPIDPSRLFRAGDDAAGSSSVSIASISSAVTREGCIDLVRRLGRIKGEGNVGEAAQDGGGERPSVAAALRQLLLVRQS